jgi:hypothetical protein
MRTMPEISEDSDFIKFWELVQKTASFEPLIKQLKIKNDY